MIKPVVTNDVRSWVDNTGLYKVRGRVSSITDSHVRLIKENGRYSTVPLRRLSPSDYRHVMALKEAFGQDLLDQVVSN